MTRTTVSDHDLREQDRDMLRDKNRPITIHQDRQNMHVWTSETTNIIQRIMNHLKCVWDTAISMQTDLKSQ